VPQPTRPQLAIYAAAAIAVLLIGARFLRSQDGAAGGGGLGATVAGAPTTGGEGSGAPDPGTDGAAAGGMPDGALAGKDTADPPLAADGALVVDVKGAVRRPGVYRLQPGARALDAVRQAGGVTRRADRLGVNLAARVTDGGEVVVPARGAGGAGSVAGSGGAVGGRGPAGGASDAAGGATRPLAIDINTASAQELEQLDGVGPATAARIVAYREANGGFSSIDELDEVSGIGEARLAAIRAQLGL
jgi:competence protein ComEA